MLNEALNNEPNNARTKSGHALGKENNIMRKTRSIT
jgi:hypothetical protein